MKSEGGDDIGLPSSNSKLSNKTVGNQYFGLRSPVFKLKTFKQNGGGTTTSVFGPPTSNSKTHERNQNRRPQKNVRY